MAENVPITPGSGLTVAADDIGLVKFQRIKLTLGADGVNDGDISSANPIPAIDAALSAKIGEVQSSPTANTVLARLKAITDALSAGITVSSITSIAAGNNNIGNVDVLTLPAVTQGTSPWVIGDGGTSVTVDAVDLDIRNLSSGTDTVGSAQSGAWTVAVTQTTSPWVIGDGGGSVTVDAVNLDVRDLTHASDSVRLGDGTDLTTVRVLGSSGALDVSIVDGSGNQITSFSGGTQFAEDAALGSTPIGTLGMARRDDSLGTLTPVEDDAVSLRTNSRGALWTKNDGVIDVGSIASALPAGTNNIGDVDVLTLPAVTQGTSPWVIGDGGGSITVDAVDLDVRNLVFATDKADVSGSTVAATQSGSWAVTANAGTNLNTSALALESTLSLLNAKVVAVNTGAVTISAALPAGTNNIGDVDVLTLPAITGTVTANAGANLNTSALALESGGNLAAILTKLQGVVAVSGTVAATQSGTWAVGLSAGTNNIGDVDVLTMPAVTQGSNPWVIGDGGASVTVDAVNLDIRDLTHVTDSVRLGDGTDLATVRPLGSTGALDVSIVDAAGNQITSFGGGSGGTQYSEDTALGSTPTGTLAIARRDDALGTLTPVDDDAVSLRTNNRGALWTKHDGAIDIGSIASAMPAGTNNIGDVDVLTLPAVTQGTSPWVIGDGGSSITVDAVDLDVRNLLFATDKVDVSGSILGTNSGVDIGDVTINNAVGVAAVNIQDGGNSITIDGTVGVSGTVAVTQSGVWAVTANAGTNLNTSALALESTLSSINAKVTAVNTGAVTISTAIPAGANNIGDVDVLTLPAVTQGTSPWVIGDGGGAITVDASNLDIRDLTHVTDSVRLGDGTDLTTVRVVGSVGALDVAIVDGSGNQITSFGGGSGGTQYLEDVALGATPTGTLAMARRDDTLGTLTPVDDDAVSLRTNDRGALWIKHDGAIDVGSIASALPAGTNNIGDVDVLSLPSLPAGTNNIGDVDVLTLPAITGTVTANAGTNLNTSALALEAGGNLSAIAASASVLDDWDESDRAKVNPIAGQVGVQGGSGAVSALTQRVVLATDIALPTGTNSIGQVTANAGTNLNTSSLALEAGGNLDDIAAALAGTITVGGTVSATQSGTWNVGLSAGSNNIGDVDVLTLPAVTQGTSPWVIGDGGGSITVDGSISVSGAVDTELPAAAALADNFSNPTAPAVGAFLMGFDGTNWDRVRADGGAVFIQDGGNSITVDGTVAVSGTVAVTQSGTWNINNISGTVSLPTGAATASLQTQPGVDIGDVTINNAIGAAAVNIQDGGNSITVDGSVTANAGTNLNTSALALEAGGNLAAIAASASVLDDWDESDRAKVNPIAGQAGVQGASGAVSANTQRVVLATDVALPAGANAIGKLAVNSGVDIGDVDVTSVLPGTGATNLGKAEDAAHTTGDVGVAVWGVRNDAGSAFGADGDYVPLSVDSSGALRVTGGSGGTQYTEGDTDATITGTAMLWEDTSDTLSAVSASKPLPVGDAGGSLTVDNAVISVVGGGTEASAQRVTIASDSTGVLSVDDNGGSLTVDGTVSISGSVTADTELPAAAALTDNFANPTAPAVGAFSMGWDGTNWDRVRADGGSLFIQDGGNSITVDGTIAATQSGTWNITNISGTVSLPTGAATSALQTQPGVDIGDVTINNASGVSAVNVQDGGNSITVDAPVGTPAFVRLSDGSSAIATLPVSLASVPSHAVTNAGVFVVQENGAALTSLQLIDDYVNAINTAFSKAAVIAGQLDDVSITAATEDNVAPVRITAQRAFHTNLRNVAGTEVGTSGAPLRVDPTGTTTQPVSAASLPLPSGAATSALQTQPGVDIGDVTVNNSTGAAAVNIQDGGNSITVDGTIAATQSGTWNITNISGTVSLPTGAATSALQTQPGVDIGDVTINNASGAAAVNIQDGGNSITVDGTVAATQSGAWTVAGTGTFTTQDTASQVDDAAFTPATSRILMIGAEADETSSDAVDEGDGGALRMTLQRGLHINLRNASGAEVGVAAAAIRVDPTGTTAQPVTDNGGSLTVDGTVSISGAVTADTELPAAAALADNTANPTVPGVGSFLMGFDGTLWDRIRADGGSVFIQDGGNSITIDGNVAATQSGTWNITNISGTVSLPTGAATAALQTQPGVDIGDVTINNAAGASAVNIQDGGNSITVDGTVALSGSIDTELPAAAALTDNFANPTAPAVGAFNMGWDGTNWDRIRADGGSIFIQDGGNSITVDGTVAATQSGTWNITNVSGTVSLPTGAATSALQTQPGVDIGDVTINNASGASAVNIQDGGNSITVDGTVAVTNADIATIAGAVHNEDVASANAHPGIGCLAVQKITPANTAGSDGDYEFLQMSAGRLWTSAVIDTALPAGTNGIGKLTANSGVTIGAVEIAAAQTLATVTTVTTLTGTTSLTPGTAATNLGKAEDAVHTTGDVGVAVWGVRNDAGAAFAADGDYVPLSIDSAGALRVTGGGGGTQYTEGDIDATITGTVILWEDASDTLRAVSAAKPLPIGDAGGSLTVDAPVGTPVFVRLSDGSAAQIGQQTMAASLPVVLASNQASIPVAATLNAETTKVIGTIRIASGGVASGSFASGSIASGALASGSIASGAIVAGAVAAGATSFVKLEDAASADSDAGVPAMAIQKATPANTAGTDGDYAMLQMSAGRLWASTVIDTALPAGANAIGKLAANSGVDIGDVDVTSIIPGTGANNLGKAEDSVHTSGDVGVMMLGVRSDASIPILAGDGDYIPLSIDAIGNLRVVVDPLAALTVQLQGFGGDQSTILIDGSDGRDPAAGPELFTKAVVSAFNGSTIDRIRGDVANGLDVDVTRSAQPTLAAAVFQVEGSIAGTSLTGSYATVLDLSDNTKIIEIRNSCNQTILLSFDGGTTLHKTVESRFGAMTIDLAAAGLKTTAVVSCKHAGVAPTSGTIYVTGIS